MRFRAIFVVSILKRTRASQNHNSTLRSVFVYVALAVALSLTWSSLPASAASESKNKINAELLKQLQDLVQQLSGLGLGYKVTADNMARYCIGVQKADKIATQIEALIEPLKQEHAEKLSPGLIRMETGAKEIHEGHSKAVQACEKNNHPMDVGPSNFDWDLHNGLSVIGGGYRELGGLRNGGHLEGVSLDRCKSACERDQPRCVAFSWGGGVGVVPICHLFESKELDTVSTSAGAVGYRK